MERTGNSRFSQEQLLETAQWPVGPAAGGRWCTSLQYQLPSASNLPPTDGLLPWHPVTDCIVFFLIHQILNILWLLSLNQVGFGLGFLVLVPSSPKIHCSCCVFMQADFEDLRWLGTLTCTTSVLLSKLQSIEWIFLYVCWFQTARRNQTAKKLLLYPISSSCDCKSYNQGLLASVLQTWNVKLLL